MATAGPPWASAPSRQGSAPFTIQTDGGVAWFADPTGQKFWSFGVDCVGPGSDWGEFDPKNPSYSGYRLFDTPGEWTHDTFAKLREWGFNSLGGWSDVNFLKKYGKAERLPYFEVLHLGAYARAPFIDIFTAEAKKAMRDAARDQIRKLSPDPLLAGYFSDNELGWWGDTLFITYLGMPPSAPGKRRLMAVIRRHYGNDFNRLKADWVTEAHSFDELNLRGKMTLRAAFSNGGGHGMELVNDWLREMGKYYYSLVHDAIRTYDSRRLILGDRYCQFYELPIVESARPYVDVISANFGATWNDGTFARFFLDTLHRISGKPVVITEFYMGANENRSGNRNTPAAFPVVGTQRERAAAFATNVHGLAELPYVVGAHWFQFYDEPPKGRGDGENFNHGLVDIYGKPYEEMVSAARDAEPGRVHANAPARTAATSIPPAPTDPMGDIKAWPRDVGFVSPNGGEPFGDMYVCRDAQNLYISVLEMEFMDEHLYPSGRIPESERSELRVALRGGTSLDVRFGGHDRKVVASRADVGVSETPGLQYRVTAKIPLSLVPPAGSGTHIAASLTTHSQSHRMSWDSVIGN